MMKRNLHVAAIDLPRHHPAVHFLDIDPMGARDPILEYSPCFP